MDKRTKILIVGGGKGGTALLDMFCQDDLVEIIGITDLNDSAPGLVLARERGIPTSNDYNDFIEAEGLREIINVTGLDVMQDELISVKPKNVEVIGGHSSEFLWRLVEKHKSAEDVFLNLSKTLIKLGDDFDENIELITSACGKTLEGTCAIYNRMHHGLLCSLGKWQTPDGYDPVDNPEGHICYDVLCNSKRNEVFAVSDLSETEYINTDPNVKKYGLKSYIGCPVLNGDECVGTLCVVFTETREFDDAKRQVLQIFSDVLSREEYRNATALALRESEEKYRTLVETVDHPISIVRKDGNILFLNDTGKSDINVIGSEYIGKTLWDYFSKEIADEKMEIIRLSIDSGEKIIKEIQSEVQGHNRWYQLTIQPIRDSEGVFTSALILAVDITDQKISENVLKDTRDYFDRIINSVADPIFVKDRGHRWITVNNAFCRLMGHSREDLIGRSDADYFSKEETEVFWQKDDVVFDSKEENINEENLTDADGRTHTIITKKALHTDDRGEEFLVGVIRDVTEQKMTEKALKASEEKYRLLAENTSDNLWTMDISGNLLYTSQAVERLFGFTAQEVIHMGLKGLLTPESFGKAMQLLQEAISSVNDGWGEESLSKIYSLETEMYHKNGGTVFTESVMRFMRDSEGEIRVLGVTRDVTERKLVQDKLRQREQEFSLIFENTQDAIFWADPDTGRFIDCNHAGEELLERKKNEILGQSFYMVHPENRLYEYKKVFAKAVKEAVSQSLEAEVLTKSGKIKYVLISATMVVIGDKKIMQGVFHDITRRKEAEIERAKQRELIDRTNRELMWKIEELEAAMSHIKKLEGLVPICANCKKMRLEGADPKDPQSWQSMERYISDRTDASFTHGLCPDCVKKMYGDALKRKGKEE